MVCSTAKTLYKQLKHGLTRKLSETTFKIFRRMVHCHNHFRTYIKFLDTIRKIAFTYKHGNHDKNLKSTEYYNNYLIAITHRTNFITAQPMCSAALTHKQYRTRDIKCNKRNKINDSQQKYAKLNRWNFFACN